MKLILGFIINLVIHIYSVLLISVVYLHYSFIYITLMYFMTYNNI